MITEEDNEEDCIPATQAESVTIRAINKTTVHKICSGQVVLSLAVAIKELVENAIDAGATLVEVKLREQGLESIEVSDNGSGVEEGNLEAMTAKYHTSKLNDYDDLLGIETFGFRGEALSSLCALADMTIITRHKNTDVAIKINLDHNGKITERVHCSRAIGTTVTLTQLFATLPVRRRDFTRNIKREFTKMCHMLQAYCLVAKGVRIICSNSTTKSGKTVVMQTQGSQDILANITSLFGARQSGELLPLKPAFDEDELLASDNFLEELNLTDSASGSDSQHFTEEDLKLLKTGKFQIEGYISKCSHGDGRSTKDRQFFFVNSRPCDPKNISKVVNDIYHRFNSHQNPFVYLNVIAERSDIDVNLTPDKRQLLIHNEKILLMIIKKSLLNTFDSIPSQCKMENTSIVSFFKTSNETEPATKNRTELATKANDKSLPEEGKEKEKEEEEIEEQEDNETLIPISTSQKFMDVLSQWRHTGDTRGPAPVCRVTSGKRKGTSEIEARTLKMQKIQEYLTRELPASNDANTKFLSYKSESESESEELQQRDTDQIRASQNLPNIERLNKASKDYDMIASAPVVERIDCKVSAPIKPFLTFLNVKPKQCESEGESLPNTQETIKSNATEKTDLNSSQENVNFDSDDDDNHIDDEIDNDLLANSQISPMKTIKLDDDNTEDDLSEESYACTTIRTSIEEIAAKLKAEEAYKRECRAKAKLQRLRFKSDINPSENKNAETELQTELSKSDFARMEIIGQFNLGFIIVQLDDDLFIVDQHATDEKYNFEMLQQTTTLQSQPLAVPQPLELTVVNEMVLIDNLSVFEKNGFKFQIDENAPPTHKVRLLCKPFSKNWEFGKEDIDELIFMLQDAPEGSICRPSRIRDMFASRACRKSIMIGTALNEGSMRKLVTHMGEIEQPWNCPHGRPTIRHLINLGMIEDSEEEDTESDGEAT